MQLYATLRVFMVELVLTQMFVTVVAAGLEVDVKIVSIYCSWQLQQLHIQHCTTSPVLAIMIIDFAAFPCSCLSSCLCAWGLHFSWSMYLSWRMDWTNLPDRYIIIVMYYNSWSSYFVSLRLLLTLCTVTIHSLYSHLYTKLWQLPWPLRST